MLHHRECYMLHPTKKKKAAVLWCNVEKIVTSGNQKQDGCSFLVLRTFGTFYRISAVRFAHYSIQKHDPCRNVLKNSIHSVCVMLRLLCISDFVGIIMILKCMLHISYFVKTTKTVTLKCMLYISYFFRITKTVTFKCMLHISYLSG